MKNTTKCLIIALFFILIMIVPNYFFKLRQNITVKNYDLAMRALEEQNPLLCKKTTNFLNSAEEDCFGEYVKNLFLEEDCKTLPESYSNLCSDTIRKIKLTTLKETAMSKPTGYYDYVEDNKITPLKLVEKGADTNGNEFFEFIIYEFYMESKEEGLFHVALSISSDYPNIRVISRQLKLNKGTNSFLMPANAQTHFAKGTESTYPLSVVISKDYGTKLRALDFYSAGPYPNLEKRIDIQKTELIQSKTNLILFSLFMIISGSFLFFTSENFSKSNFKKK